MYSLNILKLISTTLRYAYSETLTWRTLTIPFNKPRCQHMTEDKCWTNPLILMVSQVRKSENSYIPSHQWRTQFWGCKPKDIGNPHWKNSFIEHKLLLVSVFLAFAILCLSFVMHRTSLACWETEETLDYHWCSYVWTVNAFGKGTHIKAKAFKSLKFRNVG